MFLAKHPNGKYYIYYEKPDGRRSSKSTRTKYKNDATKFLLKFQNELREKADQKFIPIKLKQFSFDFLRHSEPLYSFKTIKTFKTTFNLLQNHFCDISLSELTTPRIEEYLFTRLKNSFVYAARHDLSNLNCAFNKAVRTGYLLSNPCQGIKRFKIPEKQPMFYSIEDFNKLINAIDERDLKDLTIFAVNTGLRQGELITLEWRQINIDEKTLILDNRTHLTKAKKVRTVPLNNNAVNILLERFKEKSDKHNYVFSYKGNMINQDYLSRYYKKFILAAGLNPKLNFHSLRHTFASWLVQSGVSLYVVSKLLGHSDITTTQIYSHLSKENFKNAVDLLIFK